MNEQTIEANRIQSYCDDAQSELANRIRFSSKDAENHRDGLTTASMEIEGISARGMWMLGASVLISYLITALFYEHYIISVWCFFSSIISISVYAVMIEILFSKQQITPV